MRSIGTALIGALVLTVWGASGLPARAAPEVVPAFSPVAIVMGPASQQVASCLPNAQARATVVPGPLNDTMTLVARGLPPFAGFDLYATASPHEPYGYSLPLSIVQADANGMLETRVQSVLLGAAAIGGSGVPESATHLVLFFDSAEDTPACAASAYDGSTKLDGGRTVGPAVLVTASAGGKGPLARAPFAPPGAGISTPSEFSSQSAEPTTFTTSCSDPAGWTSIRFIDFRLSNQAGMAFWARLDRPAKLIYTYDPASRRWNGGVPPGAVRSLGTPLVQLKSSNVQGTAGTTGKVVWTVVFSKQAAGQTFRQSVRVIDQRNQSRGWTDSGSWSVT